MSRMACYTTNNTIGKGCSIMSKFGSYGTKVKFEMNCKCFTCKVEWKAEMVKREPLNTFIPIQYWYCPTCLEQLREGVKDWGMNDTQKRIHEMTEKGAV